MTPEEIKNELQNKIKEFERQSRLISLEVITWLQDLIKRIDEKKVEEKPVEKEVKVKLDTSLMEDETVEEIKEIKKASKTKGKGKWK